jgi:hypothetical protein
MLQLAPAANVAPQAFAPVEIAKSSKFTPPMPGTMPVTTLLPVLVKTAASAAEVVCAVVVEKANKEVNVTELAGCAPIPRRVAVCGDPVALSATESAAEKPVTEDGVNVT